MQATKKIVFLGSKALGAKILETLCKTVPDSVAAAITIEDKNDKRGAYKQFQAIAKQHDIPLLCAQTNKQAEAFIKEYKPDFCLVVCWYWFISTPVLESVPLGFAGIHYSLLPHNRGGSPLVWSLINGEKKIGLSLFTLAPGMDTGDVWAQKTVNITDDTTIKQALELLEQQAIKVVCENIKGILCGTITPWKQDHSKANIVPQRNPEDGVVDWNKSALEIHRFIRAQSFPYPGAFSFFDNQKIRFEHSYPTQKTTVKKAGTIENVNDLGLLVACGDKRLICIDEFFINGENISITPNTVLDPQ